MKKNIIGTLFLLLCFLNGTYSQKNFDIRERNVMISLGERTGYSITLSDMNEKDVVKTLKSWLEDRQKKPTVEETGKHEIMVEGILLQEFSAVPMNLYFLFEEGKEEVVVTGFFSVEGVFVSGAANPDKARVATEFMKKFGLRTEKLKIMASLDEAQKELSKREDEQKELEKKNEQLNKTIEDCTATIEKAKNDLEQNKKDQDAKKSEISSQHSTVDKIEGELKNYEGF